MALILLVFGGALRAQQFVDRFADRQLLTEVQGTLAGDNRGATLEAGEPRHGEKPGGHSLWISWVCPTNGVVTLSTEQTGFDTVIAVYRLESGDGDPFDRLHRVGDDDDSDDSEASLLQFGARAGTRYEIAVDGYGGAMGTFLLRWELLSSATPPPVVLGVAGDRALKLGETLVLSVDLQAAEGMRLHWYRNGRELEGEEDATLVVTNLQPEHLGQYKLRLSIDDLRFFTSPVEVQINSEGETNLLARDKLLDALANGLTQPPIGGAAPAAATPRSGLSRSGLSPQGPLPGVVRGYSGTQIFNTTYARRDPAEPAHCNVTGGPTYWFGYQPPETGMLAVDTMGSSYDTVLAVYTFDPPLVGYSNLVEVACDHRGATNSVDSAVYFPASRERTYFVVVEGVNGAKGIANLHYRLDAPATNAPPEVWLQPEVLTVRQDQDVQWALTVLGTGPLRYRWCRNNHWLDGETNAVLRRLRVKAADAGEYCAVVNNPFGSTTSAVSRLRVLVPPVLSLTNLGAGQGLTLPGIEGVRYTLEGSDPALLPAWRPLTVMTGSAEGLVVFAPSAMTSSASFYRVRAD